MLLPARGLSGLDTLLPFTGDEELWVEHLQDPTFTVDISSTLRRALDISPALQSMDRLALGIVGRPLIEMEAREQLEEQLSSTHSALAAMVATLDTDLVSNVNALIDSIRSGEVNHARQEYISTGIPNDLINTLVAITDTLDAREFAQATRK